MLSPSAPPFSFTRSQAALLTKIRRLANLAAVANPLINPIATGVTVTQTTTDATMGRAYTVLDTTATGLLANTALYGGSAITQGSPLNQLIGAYGCSSNISVALASRPVVTAQTPNNFGNRTDLEFVGSILEFMTDAPSFQIGINGFYPNKYRMYVDDKLVTPPQRTAGTTHAVGQQVYDNGAVWAAMTAGAAGSTTLTGVGIADGGCQWSYAGTQWATGQVCIGKGLTGATYGQTYCFNAGKIYYATTSGTTGSTAPTHSSGAVSDGGVTWQYVSAVSARANSTNYQNLQYVTNGGNLYQITGSKAWGTSAASGGPTTLGVYDGTLYWAWVGTVGTWNFDTANQYLKVAFGSSAVRKITLEIAQNAGINSIAVNANYSIWKPSQADVLNAVFVTDSYGFGGGIIGDSYLRCWLDVCSHMMGWRNRTHCSIGGTGFLATNGGSYSTYRQRQPDWAGLNADALTFQGSVNDVTFGNTAIAAEVRATLQLARSTYPNALINVTGVSAPSGSNTANMPNATVTSFEAAMQAAVTAMNDSMMLFVPISTANSPVFFGSTGSLNPTGASGNNERLMHQDNTHPLTPGHELLARLMHRGLRDVGSVALARVIVCAGCADFDWT